MLIESLDLRNRSDIDPRPIRIHKYTEITAACAYEQTSYHRTASVTEMCIAF